MYPLWEKYEVKIRDCPGAFGTDGGSANLPKVKIFSTLQLHHLILAFIIHNQIIFVYIHKYIHALYIMNCSKKRIVLVNFIYDDTS